MTECFQVNLTWDDTVCKQKPLQVMKDFVLSLMQCHGSLMLGRD